VALPGEGREEAGVVGRGVGAAIYRAMCILGKGGEREWDWRFGADEHVREKRMIYGAYGK
jgi:hypothetical protein